MLPTVHLRAIHSAVLTSGSDLAGVRGQVEAGSAVAEAVGVTAGHVGFFSGKEKASPASRPTNADPQVPDSESVIVAMERVSVLFDRYRNLLPTASNQITLPVSVVKGFVLMVTFSFSIPPLLFFFPLSAL